MLSDLSAATVADRRKFYALLCCWNLKRKPKQAARHVGAVRVENLAPVVKKKIGEEAIKLGEWPPLGSISCPGNCSNLLNRIVLFSIWDGVRKARGMGIGAFAYYRRVVRKPTGCTV